MVKRTPFYTFARKYMAWVFAVLTPMRVRDREKIPGEGKAILCCNHASMLDPLRLAYGQKRQIYFMAKEELFRNKFVSLIITALGAFPVSRGKGDKTAIRTAKMILDEGRMLGIFIEGTRSRDGRFLRPKSGAVMLAHNCGAPIVPCCITPVRGPLPKPFRPCFLSFGDPIPPEELQIHNGTPSEYRNASLLVMSRIAALREKDKSLTAGCSDKI